MSWAFINNNAMQDEWHAFSNEKHTTQSVIPYHGLN